MAYKTVQADWLIKQFQLMLNEKWRYVADSARYGEADCSGAFAYWYAQAGSYMPHGSNSILRKYTVKYGKIGEIELKPGMAVFRWSDDGNEPDQYRSDGLGNFRHIGLYVGNGRTIEMKDTATGVYEGKISQWHYAAELRYTNYNVSEGKETPTEEFTPFEGKVTTSGGTLRLRKTPSISGTIKASIPNNTPLWLSEKQGNWYKTSYNDHSGWVSADFITVAEPEFYRQISVEISDEDTYHDLTVWLVDHNVDFWVQGGID